MNAHPESNRAEDWAVWLTNQPSVTGSQGERDLPHLLLRRIRDLPVFRDAECWLIDADDDPGGRKCLAVLVRGSGPETVLLTGHFDTVTVDDYGDLAPLATDPHALRSALLERLSDPATPAEALARADLEGGDFLPGRGLLDMKAGLAAGLAALEAFAQTPDRQGNLLFVAVPDEEVNSVGARALAAALPQIEATQEIEVAAGINLDCIADEGDGAEGRAVALGSVGKLLLTALVVGQATHASHAFQGLNAAALAGAVAARLEWASELADSRGGQAGIPPLLLSLKDAKLQYDVTTPAMAFATWNALSQGRGAAETMAVFRKLVGEAADDFCGRLAARRQAVLGTTPDETPAVQILDVAALAAGLDDSARAELDRARNEAAADGLSLPDQNQRVTETVWRLSGRRGPAVILGFGSLPYPAVSLTDSPAARRLRAAVEGAAAEAANATGQSVRMTPFFPGISDMSFLGEAEAGDLPLMIANTPAWESGVRWSGATGGVPIVNIGPWGRAFHTPLERLHAPYAFGVLPGLLLDAARRILRPADAGAGASR